MKRKLSISSALMLVLMAVLLTFLLTHSAITAQFNQKLLELDAGRDEFQKLSTLDEIVREHFALKVDEVAQSEASIAGYIEGLGDPYSRYLSAEEYAEYLSTKQEKVLYTLGFSAAYNEETKLARVYYVEQGSDAANFGLSVGDTLLTVGGVSVKMDGFEAVCKVMSGKQDTTTGVVVERDGEKITYTLTYDNWKADRVSAVKVLSQAGLITIHRFEDGTKEDLKGAIDRIVSAGVDALIFDVRSIQSMNFDEAIECADVISGMSELARILTGGEKVEVVKGDGASVPFDCAVLVDFATSGAPELFAASLRDAVGAKVVGTASAGRAGVQADIRLNDNSALILTTKVYLPPISDSFDKVGVTPDLEVENSVDFRSLAHEDDVVLREAYYLLRPDRVPGEDTTIDIPEQDPDVEDPELIEQDMQGGETAIEPEQEGDE